MRLRGIKTGGDAWRLEIDGTRDEILRVLDILRSRHPVPRDPDAMWDDAETVSRAELARIEECSKC